MGLCGLTWLMDICIPRHPCVGNRKPLETESPQLYQEYGKGLPGTVYLFCHIKGEWLVWCWLIMQPKYLLSIAIWHLVFCGTNLWPWLPPGGLAFVPGFENLGFHWEKGRIWPMETEIGYLLLLSVRWANSVFHWCHHLATFVFSSMGLEDVIAHSSVQFSCSVMSTLWDPMDCSTQGFPVHHQLLELAQTHVHWVGDAIQPSPPLSSPSPPAFNLSQHQDLFQWVSSSHQVAKVLEFQL